MQKREEKVQAEVQQEAPEQEEVVKDQMAVKAQEEAANERANKDVSSDASKEVKDGARNNASTDPNLKLFVGDLAKGTKKSDLEKYFSEFGTVAKTTIEKRKRKGELKRFGFVFFDNKDAIEKVLEKESHEVNGSTVVTRHNKNRNGQIRVKGIKFIEDDVVKTYFKNFGEIDTYRRIKDKTTDKTNACIISFEDDSSFERCLREKHEINGRTVKVYKRFNDDRNPHKETENRRKVGAVKDTMIKGKEVSVDKTAELKEKNRSKKVSRKNKQNEGNGKRFNGKRYHEYWIRSDDYGKPYRNDQGYGDHTGYQQYYNQGPNQYYNQGPNQNYDQGPNQNYDQESNQNYDQGSNQNYNQGSNQNYDYQRNYSNQGGYGGYGYQKYGGYGDYYQGYVYDQGYGNFQGYGNQGGYRGYQQQGGFQRE